MSNEPWSENFSGERFYYGDSLETSKVLITDIAHHLALTNRYGGATKFPYSVAQHSYLIAEALWTTYGDPYLALDGLMHDGEEYVGPGDVIQPFKVTVPELKARTSRIDKHIRATFKDVGLIQEESRKTKWFDLRIMVDEKAVLMRHPTLWGVLDGLEPLGVTIEEWPWQKAEKKFLECFGGLTALIAHRERGRLLANDLHIVE